MTTAQMRSWTLWTLMIVALVGCGSPTPAAKTAGPPPPPPAPAPEPKPAPPPPRQEPDPYEVAMGEVSSIVKRYGTIYASIKDEASADKAVEEIGRMTARLRELATQTSTIPYRTGQEKFALTLQTELAQLQTAQLSNPDMQRVLSDPDLALKFIAAHQSFVTEGLLPFGQVVALRQPSAPQQSEPPSAPPGSPPAK